MFERIKCYKQLRMHEKLLLDIRRLGEITHDEKMIREANETLYKNCILKKKMLFDRTIAERYNLELLRRGFE